MLDTAGDHMAARAHDLEPTQVAQRLVRAGDGGADRVLDALLRRSDDLDDPVNVVAGELGLVEAHFERKIDRTVAAGASADASGRGRFARFCALHVVLLGTLRARRTA